MLILHKLIYKNQKNNKLFQIKQIFVHRLVYCKEYNLAKIKNISI